MMSKPALPGPTLHTNELVRRMFIDTADQNYATARWAYLNGLNVDFFWLGLQALEKYFKAILLLNGRSAKLYGHDIEGLYRAVLALDPALSFGPLTKPAQIVDEVWRDETVEDFIMRMNDQGDPNNRYMLYGYILRTDDLFKLDQLAWSVRRHCRPFQVTLKAHGLPEKRIDRIEELRRNPGYWHLGGMYPIEKAAAGKASDEIRKALFNLNFAFAPDYQHVSTWARSAAANPPLANWFQRLKSQQASPGTRKTANDTLQWVLENVHLTKGDRKIVEDALAAQANQAPPSGAPR